MKTTMDVTSMLKETYADKKKKKKSRFQGLKDKLAKGKDKDASC